MKQKLDYALIAILVIIVFNAGFNIQGFPEYFWDQGVYVDRAINFLKTSQVYEDPNYIDHPPLGWLVTSVFFDGIGFPGSVIHLSKNNDLAQQIVMLFLIPRLIGILFTVITSILIYKISMALHRNRNFAIASLVAFALVPAIWPFRNLLLDPVMITLVLSSLYVLFPKDGKISDKNTSKMKINYKILFSGILFGAAILVKLTSVFFLPAVLLFAMGYGSKLFYNKKITIPNGFTASDHSEHVEFTQRITHGIVWVLPVFAALGAWILFLSLSEHTLSHLTSTQFWQLERTSKLPYGTPIELIFMATPIGLVFGIIGLAQILKKKSSRMLSILALPYIGFLFRGGFVGFVHTIPILPILSIFAGKPLYQLAEKIQKVQTSNYKIRASHFLVILLVISISITVWIASFDAAKSHRDAVQFLITGLPKNSVLITDPGYGWVIKIFRPDVKVTDYYSFNYIHKIPNDAFIAESSSPTELSSTLTHSQKIYDESCLVKKFVHKPFGTYFNPYSTTSDRHWNVEVRYFSIRGCA